MTEKEIITFRLTPEIKEGLRDISVEEGKDKSKILRELLAIGIRERKLEIALKLYTDGKITLWKAARLSGTPLWRMIEILEERRISVHYTQKELTKDLEALG